MIAEESADSQQTKDHLFDLWPSFWILPSASLIKEFKTPTFSYQDFLRIPCLKVVASFAYYLILEFGGARQKSVIEKCQKRVKNELWKELKWLECVKISINRGKLIKSEPKINANLAKSSYFYLKIQNIKRNWSILTNILSRFWKLTVDKQNCNNMQFLRCSLSIATAQSWSHYSERQTHLWLNKSTWQIMICMQKLPES